jgi:hypothetical protein
MNHLVGMFCGLILLIRCITNKDFNIIDVALFIVAIVLMFI